MPRCVCGHVFADDRQLSRHKKKCAHMHQSRLDTVQNARLLSAAEAAPPPAKKPRWTESLGQLANDEDLPFNVAGGSSGVRPVERSERPGATFMDLNLNPPPPAEHDQRRLTHISPPTFTRAGRMVHPTQKVLDGLPEEPGTVEQQEIPDASLTDTADQGGNIATRPRVTLLLTERIRSAANRFGISRLYKRKPTRAPSDAPDLAKIYTPTAPSATASRAPRAIKAIISPFPNLSSWLFSHHYWSQGHKKTQDDRQAMQDILTRPDFDANDIRGVNFKKLDEELATAVEEHPWVLEGEGWKRSPLTIEIPLGQKPTRAATQATSSAQRRADRLESIPDEPVENPFRGQPYVVDALWHKDMTAEIKTTFESDPAAAGFVFDPCLLYYAKPGSANIPEGVYGELYNSPVVVQEDIRLQNSPREPGCNLPLAIAKIILYSDGTNVTQFGNTSMWPGYMWFGNQSKYERARPTAHAAHHIAYFPKLPDAIQDEIRRLHGKPASAALLTHLRRELWHAGWDVLLDDRFIEACHHGIVVDCADGIRRRIYPRVFLYSADYPEKMLVAALRDKGKYPCPHCGVTFDDIIQSGTDEDKALRQATARADNDERKALVKEARDLIYDSGYVVNSDRVDGLLKSRSLVPTVNAFSAKLSGTGMKFDFHKMLAPDVLHELELGVWKSVFAHLIRILESVGPHLINELNARFRQVPVFGENTIRKFAANVSDMSNMAALHYEDILQCSIPVFEGLLPEPYNTHIQALLYSIAYFHCLAKMRLHTDTSVALLDHAYSVMASHLRHFHTVICPRFQTKETTREYTARMRAQANGTARGPVATESSGRKPRSFNMSTIKMHLLGYYATYIPLYGTTDGYNTMIGEHEHKRLKARRARTSYRNTESQMANIDLRERRFHRMASELAAQGVPVPGHFNEAAKADGMKPEEHHRIPEESDARIAVYLREFQSEFAGDPAVENFGFKLQEHIRLRLLQELEGDAVATSPLVHPGSVHIKHDRIYRHATFRVNFTTYDMQRDQDVIHCYEDRSGDKVHVLVQLPASSSNFPWKYATVLGVFHAQVFLPDRSERRVEFLWVRWLETDPTWIASPATRRLDRVQYVSEDAFGFLDPATVIRGCHLIPAFHHGRDIAGGWKYQYVDRFVDRDMGARFAGIGIGNLDTKAKYSDTLTAATDIESEVLSRTSAGNTSVQDVVDEEDITDEDAESLFEGDLGLQADVLTSVSCRMSLPQPNTATLAQSSASHTSTLLTGLEASNNEVDARQTFAATIERLNTEDARSATVRSRRINPDSLTTKGAKFAVMVDMWRDLDTIIDVGLHVSIAQGTADSRFTHLIVLYAREHTYHKIYQGLTAIVPELETTIQAQGVDAIKHLTQQLYKGQCSLRSTVAHGVKVRILSWLKVTDINNDDKYRRGFDHEVCGRLLCPVTYDWDDEAVRNGLRSGNAQYRAGFCRNELLVEALAFILFGEQVAESMNAEEPVSSKNKNSKPRASTWKARTVTLPAIGFAAVVIHFGLSSQASFSAGGSAGKFHYQGFYQYLVNYLEEEYPSAERKDLLRWWNRRFSMGAVLNDAETGIDKLESQDGSSAPLSAMARMYAQATKAQAGQQCQHRGQFGDDRTNEPE
ncbi:hypothetical protein NM688_g6717 [Phlebia brevispora]|uniref:Uncharacterized protein n=1 Tax=Phlebia brevispora TaxID=194682 RepID=A0ACC1SDF3_9APHY|nr:hypothetical protein NM688_g6717 [Phlebia brevispora]